MGKPLSFSESEQINSFVGKRSVVVYPENLSGITDKGKARDHLIHVVKLYRDYAQYYYTKRKEMTKEYEAVQIMSGVDLEDEDDIRVVGYQIKGPDDYAGNFFSRARHAARELDGYNMAADEIMITGEEQLKIRGLANEAMRFLNSHPRANLLRDALINEMSYREVAHKYGVTEKAVTEAVLKFRKEVIATIPARRKLR